MLDAEGAHVASLGTAWASALQALFVLLRRWPADHAAAGARRTMAGSDRPLFSSSLAPACPCLQPRRKRMGGQPCWAWRCWWRWSGTAATASSERPPQPNASLRQRQQQQQQQQQQRQRAGNLDQLPQQLYKRTCSSCAPICMPGVNCTAVCGLVTVAEVNKSANRGNEMEGSLCAVIIAGECISLPPRAMGGIKRCS